MKYFNWLAVFAGFNFRLAVWWSPLVLGVLLAQAVPAQVVYYPPSGETESPDYQVTVNGQKVYCYTSYACGNSMYLNGRAVTPLTFGSFDFQGTVTVTVTFGQSLRGAGIQYQLCNGPTTGQRYPANG